MDELGKSYEEETFGMQLATVLAFLLFMLVLAIALIAIFV